MPDPAPPRLKLRLAPAAEAAVRAGHPWVFSGSVRELSREGQAGEIAVVYDRRDRFLALGFYDPGSAIALRILHVGQPATLDDAWWRARWEAALEKRRALFADAATDGFRLINGESDGWPGLVLDRYAATVVVKLYAAAWLPRVSEIVALVKETLPWAEAMVLRLSRNLLATAENTHQITEGFLFSHEQPPHETVVFAENGIRFEAEVLRGQKTGFFLDQRENRARIESLAAGRDVLNAFSFSGGFSLYAARGGARSVADLDISAHALASARRNFALNSGHPRIAAARHESIQADAFEWLAHGPRRSFDLIVADPPSLAKREAERPRALEAYARLHTAALARLRPGGILAAASCSAHVSADEFFACVRQAARRTGRPFRELWTSGHALDHPAAFPEARYLKCLTLEVSR